MRTKVITNVKDEFVETINRLIRESFGRKYRGDYNVLGGFDGSLYKGDDLSVIAKPTYLGDPQYGCGVAGILGCDDVSHPDGSVVVVKDDKTIRDKIFGREKGFYQRAAETYAQLYESNFGKEARVIVAPMESIFKVRTLSKSLAGQDFGFVARR